jgi:AraC-like DNA-binding protein
MDQDRRQGELKPEKMKPHRNSGLAESQTEFLTTLSRELRTPLSLVLTTLQEAVSSPDAPDKIRRSLAAAHKSATGLMHLVDQLKNIDNLDATEAALQVQQSDCAELIPDVFGFSENEGDSGKSPAVNNNPDMHLTNYEHIVGDQNLGKRELLVIEHDDEVRKFLVGEFAFEFSVTGAANGEDGFTMACEKIPDLIISDIALPGKCGLSVCKDIKADIRTSHIPVILLSAKESSHDPAARHATLADAYMPKPFNLRSLKAMVRQTIIARKRLYSNYSQEASLKPASLMDNAVDKEFLQKAVDYIDSNLCNPQLSVESIADLFHISRSQVYRKIKALTGQTVVELIRTVRLKYALKLMEEKKYNLSEIADQSGFNSLSYFTRTFKDQYGKAPSEYMEGIRSGF